MKNLTLEKGLLDLGIKSHKEFAKILGVSESVMSHWLSMELTENQQNDLLRQAKEKLDG